MAVVALGTFDGVHAGHRVLLRTALAEAGKDREAVVYTFSHHPRGVFAAAPRLLMPDEARLAMLASFGLRVEADAFTEDYAAISPAAFARLLVDRFAVETAVIGYNYTFGAEGAGRAETLAALGRALGFSVLTVPPVLYAGAPVSSSRIREAVEAGEMETAEAMLERPYSLSGRIVKNRGLGHTLGFPTANIAYDPAVALPKTGVYAARALLSGRLYDAVTNVGNNPTVGGTAVTVETHLLDFTGDIYGRTLEVRFLRRLRGEERFKDVEALRAQVERDKQRGRAILRGE